MHMYMHMHASIAPDITAGIKMRAFACVSFVYASGESERKGGGRTYRLRYVASHWIGLKSTASCGRRTSGTVGSAYVLRVAAGIYSRSEARSRCKAGPSTGHSWDWR